jgi:integrase
VFVTRTGKRQTDTNVAHRLKVAIKAANVKLAEDGIEPVSERVSAHSLRRAFASLRAALGDDPVYIAEALGHTDPSFTFRVYQKAVKRRERLSGAYLATFDRACEWGRIGSKGTNGPVEAIQTADASSAEQQESA